MGYNVFLTGPAGSGKTYVLNKYIGHLKKRNIKVAVTASTGIAATHLNGKTIHSWSGLGIKRMIDRAGLKKIKRNRRLVSAICKTKVLVIDEISMLNADQLDSVDYILRSIRRNHLPFGGIQMIFCGDFFQLPPVRKEGETPVAFAYASRIWKQIDLKICCLDEQHRHKDNRLIRALNAIRNDEVTEEIKAIINSCRDRVFIPPIQPVRLFTHNIDADAINRRELEKISGRVYAYNMRSRGNKKLVETMSTYCLAPSRLELKKGARVMFVKNNFEEGYVNGTLGTVVDFDEETKMPVVKTDSGRRIVAGPVSWLMEEYDEIVAEIKQVPLRLAWAITIHKSQGMSLDEAEIDLSKTFEYGMGYVALSRVPSLAGLSILGLNDMAFRVHQEAREMDKEFRRRSKDLSQEIAGMDSKEISRRQKEFFGDEFSDEIADKLKDSISISDVSYLEKVRWEFPKAYMPWTESEDEMLRELFASGQNTRQLSVVFKRKRGAIRSRLKKLGLVKDQSAETGDDALMQGDKNFYF